MPAEGRMGNEEPARHHRVDAERFRLLVEAVSDYAIYMLDPEGIVTTWNAGAQRFKGYTADEIIGQLLYGRGQTVRAACARTCDCRRRGPFRARELARSQGRDADVGPCRHRSHSGR